MNLQKAVFLVVAAGCLAVGLSGCGKGTVPITVMPLSVANSSLPVAIINKSYSTTLTPKGGLGPYSWAIISGSLPSGITMSTSGVFSGTATSTSSSDITVQVTDSQTPTPAVATAALTLKVNNALSITTKSLKLASVNVPYQVAIKADGGSQPYTWSVVSGSLPDGLKLDPSFGVIYGTPKAKGTSNFTVQVADGETPPVMVQQALELTVGGSNARFSGSYVFFFRGFNNGKLVLQAGSLVSDGMGNVTSGVTDIMATSGTSTGVSVTGTYTVDDNGHGTMSLSFGHNGSAGSGTYQIASTISGYFSFIENGDGQTTQYGSGLLASQTNVVTDLTNLKGNWVFGGYGADSSDNRYGAVGGLDLQPNSAGTSASVGSGVLDSNDHGAVSNSTAFTGNFTLPDSTTGRGSMSLTAGSTTTQYSTYFIDSADFVIIGTNPVTTSAPLILYTMVKQTTFLHIDNAILNGNGITELTAAPSPNGTPVSEAALGLFSFDGQGNFWATLDDNSGGTLTQNKPSGTYSVTANGRTTFTGLDTAPILYIANTDRGYYLGTDASVTYGEMEQQRPPQMNNASLVNANSGGSIIAPAVAAETVEVDSFNADGKTPGHLTGTYDTSGPGGPMMGLTFNATYTVESSSCTNTGTTFNTCGRFPILDANNNQIGIGYIIASLSPQRTVIMTTNAQPVINAIEQ